MADHVKMLSKIVKDPIELTSITFPSGVLVSVFFAVREKINPDLKYLPSPTDDTLHGGLAWLVLTLITALVIKRISHDLLNWSYDHLFRDRKRANKDSWFNRAKCRGLLSDDPLVDNYQRQYNILKNAKDSILDQVELIQTQSKLARSMSLVLFLIVLPILMAGASLVLAITCILLGIFMWYAFCQYRWQASELVYAKAVETHNGSRTQRQAAISPIGSEQPTQV